MEFFKWFGKLFEDRKGKPDVYRLIFFIVEVSAILVLLVGLFKEVGFGTLVMNYVSMATAGGSILKLKGDQENKEIEIEKPSKNNS